MNMYSFEHLICFQYYFGKGKNIINYDIICIFDLTESSLVFIYIYMTKYITVYIYVQDLPFDI